jgi:hypothetical protein
MVRQTRKPKVKRRKSRRVVKTKKRIRRQRGGMYKSETYQVPMDMYFPKNGYFEASKSEDYLKITNVIMSSLVSDHFQVLVDIVSKINNKYLYLTDLSNIGGEIRARSVSPTDSIASDSSLSQSTDSVEFGPTGYNLEQKIIRPQVNSVVLGSNNYTFLNIGKSEFTSKELASTLQRNKIVGEVEVTSDNIPGMPGITETTEYLYEIIIYKNTPDIKTISVLVKQKIGNDFMTIINHGIDDALLWVLFKLAVTYSRTKGATILSNDKMRFILSGNKFDRFLYKHIDSIRKPIVLSGSQMILDIPPS